MLNRKKTSQNIINFCVKLGYFYGVKNDKKYKAVKKKFLKFLDSILEKNIYIEYLYFIVETDKIDVLNKFDTYFIYDNLSWFNPKKIYYYFFTLPEIKGLLKSQIFQSHRIYKNVAEGLTAGLINPKAN